MTNRAWGSIRQGSEGLPLLGALFSQNSGQAASRPDSPRMSNHWPSRVLRVRIEAAWNSVEEQEQPETRAGTRAKRGESKQMEAVLTTRHAFIESGER